MADFDQLLGQFQIASDNRLTQGTARALLDSLVAEFASRQSPHASAAVFVEHIYALVGELAPGLSRDSKAKIAFMTLHYAADAPYWIRINS